MDKFNFDQNENNTSPINGTERNADGVENTQIAENKPDSSSNADLNPADTQNVTASDAPAGDRNEEGAVSAGTYSYSKEEVPVPRESVEWQNTRAGGNTAYGVPQMSGNGEISYAPASRKENVKTKKEKKAKKEKKVKEISKGGIALMLCLTVLLSAGMGFAGGIGANYLMSRSDGNADQTGGNTENSSGNMTGENLSFTQPGEPAVIYRPVVTEDSGSSADGSFTYSQVAAFVQDSVVEIVTDFNKTSLWFQYVASGAGSGVIVSEDGYVITNAHVITDEESGKVSDSITVRLRNGEEYKASVIGSDSDSDIAVLKIDASGLTPAVCGDSDHLVVGEEVLAVGNPLGELGGTVTNGIVSATNREMVVGDVTMNLIQTNAAVNPGNSGGGLFNMNGDLIGIVNAKSSGTDVEGLGFAIPVNDALKVFEQLMEYGYVRGKVMIGVTFLDATETSVARYYGIKPGLYVAELTEGLNDDTLEPGDRVIAVNGSEVSTYDDVLAIVKASSVGDILTFQLYRDGKLAEAEVEVFEKVPTPEDDTDVEFEETKPEGQPEMEVFPGGNASPVPDGEYIPDEDNSHYSYNPFEQFFGSWFGY